MSFRKDKVSRSGRSLCDSTGPDRSLDDVVFSDSGELPFDICAALLLAVRDQKPYLGLSNLG
jgi:hypothetical protein